MDLLGPFSNTNNGKHQVFLITTRYTNLTRAVSMAKITATNVFRGILRQPDNSEKNLAVYNDL